MAIPKCELEASVIVLSGSFNPKIFHPSWFELQNLLRPEEVEVATATDLVVSPELTVMSAGWLNLQISQSQFLATASDPASYNALRDLVLGIFRLLEHTPVTSMGLNWQFHHQMASVDERNSFGDFLVPKPPWKPLMDPPGVLTLTMDGPKPGAPQVRYLVRVEPSLRIQNAVFFEVTEQHVPKTEPSKHLMAVLEQSWQSAWNHAKNVPEQLFSAFYDQ